MENIQIKQVIISLFEQFADWQLGCAEPKVEGWGRSIDTGMYFNFDIRIDNHGYEKDGNTYHVEWELHYRKVVHIIIMRDRRVYAAVSNFSKLSDVPITEFINLSNHDSEWRGGLDIIDTTINAGYYYCYDHVPDEHRKAPNQMSMFNQFGSGFCSKECIKFVKVERGDYVVGQNYFDTLKSVKALKMRVIIEE